MRQKIVDDAAAADLVSAEFDQPVRRCFGARSFDVHDHEIEILEQARVAIVRQQFDRVIADFETAIVAHEVGDEKSGEFVVDV